MANGWDYFAAVQGTSPCGPAVLGRSSPSLGSFDISPEGCGIITANALAMQIQSTNGLPTTERDILDRAQRVGMFDADSRAAGADLDSATAIALLRGITEGNKDAAVSMIRSAIPRFGGQDQLIAVLRAANTLGLADVLAGTASDALRGALAAGESFLSRIGGTEMVQRIAREVAGWFSGTGETIASITSAISDNLPLIGSWMNFGIALGEWIHRLCPAGGGNIIPLWYGPEQLRSRGLPAGWGSEAAQVYAHIAHRMGFYVPAAGWVATYNPFLMENMLWHGRCNNMTGFRAVEAGYWKVMDESGTWHQLPDWRTVFSSAEAARWAETSPTDPPIDKYNATLVPGCMCPSAGMIRPWRWNENSPAFRAAVVATCYINGGVLGCIRGLGTWSPWTGRADNDAGDDACYNDTSPYYDLGFGMDTRKTTWWSRPSSSGVQVFAPRDPWFSMNRRGCNVYTSVTTRYSGQYAGQEPRLGSSPEQRRAVYDLLRTAGDWRPLSGISADPTIPRLGPRPTVFKSAASRVTITRQEDDPGASQAPSPTRMESTDQGGISAVAVVGGLGLLGVLLWALTK